MSDILFVNVDTLKDFMLPGGKLYVSGAEEICPVLQQITDFARTTDYKIINIADSHTKDSKEISHTPDYVNTFPPHCMKDTKGAEFIKETNPINPYIIDVGQREFDLNKIAASQEIVIKKDDVNAFTNRHTERLFKILNPKKIYVYGVVTEICVDHVVVGLTGRGYEVTVFVHAMKELSKENRTKVYDNWRDLGVRFSLTVKIIKGEAFEL